MATTASKQTRTAPKPAAPAPMPDTDPEEVAAPKKKKRGLLKIMLPILLLGGAGGGAWYHFVEQQPDEAPIPAAARAAAPRAATAKAVSSKPPMFVALEPFTVNLQNDNTSPQYLQVGLALRLVDDSHAEAFKLFMPEIRNRILLLLSSKRASDISTLEGKKSLSTDLAKEIMQPLAGRVPSNGLDGVLFTSFVVQ